MQEYFKNIDFDTSIRECLDIGLKMKIAKVRELAVAINLEIGDFFRNADEMFRLIINIVESTKNDHEGRYFQN